MLQVLCSRWGGRTVEGEGGDINGGRDCGENPPSAPQQRTGPVWQQPATTDSFCSTLTENHHRQQKEQQHHHQQQPSPVAPRLSILGKCSRCSVGMFRVQKESSLSTVWQFLLFCSHALQQNLLHHRGAVRRSLACLLGLWVSELVSDYWRLRGASSGLGLSLPENCIT